MPNIHKKISDECNNSAKKMLFNNRYNAAIKRVRALRKKQGIYYPLSQHDLIRWYAEFSGQEIPVGMALKLWLYELYKSGDDEQMKRLSDNVFYNSPEWLKLRKEVLFIYGEVCMKCKSTLAIAVDHIKPRSIYPELELVRDNLQVLCRSCNSSKSKS